MEGDTSHESFLQLFDSQISTVRASFEQIVQAMKDEHEQERNEWHKEKARLEKINRDIAAMLNKSIADRERQVREHLSIREELLNKRRSISSIPQSIKKPRVTTKYTSPPPLLEDDDDGQQQHMQFTPPPSTRVDEDNEVIEQHIFHSPILVRMDKNKNNHHQRMNGNTDNRFLDNPNEVINKSNSKQKKKKKRQSILKDSEEDHHSLGYDDYDNNSPRINAQENKGFTTHRVTFDAAITKEDRDFLARRPKKKTSSSSLAPGKRPTFEVARQPQSIQKQQRQHEDRFIEVVRTKEARQRLQGFTCTECDAMFQAVGGNREDFDLCNHSSRHRYKYEPVQTPEGYWDIGSIASPIDA